MQQRRTRWAEQAQFDSLSHAHKMRIICLTFTADVLTPVRNHTRQQVMGIGRCCACTVHVPVTVTTIGSVPDTPSTSMAVFFLFLVSPSYCNKSRNTSCDLNRKRVRSDATLHEVRTGPCCREKQLVGTMFVEIFAIFIQDVSESRGANSGVERARDRRWNNGK